MTPHSGDRIPSLRLHPVVKLAWLLALTVAVFAFDAVVVPVGAVVGVLALLLCSGVVPWRVPGWRGWVVLALGILFTHALVVEEGAAVLGPVTDVGLHDGLRAMARLLAVVLGSALFVLTTGPFELAHGLIAVGLPYRWGFALMTALRLAPVFRIEAHHVHRAQLIRGVAYDSRGPRRWWLLLRHLCLPLLVSALRTAHTLSLSMEGRGFGLHPRRTALHRLTVTRADVAALVILAAAVVAALVQGWARLAPG